MHILTSASLAEFACKVAIPGKPDISKRRPRVGTLVVTTPKTYAKAQRKAFELGVVAERVPQRGSVSPGRRWQAP